MGASTKPDLLTWELPNESCIWSARLIYPPGQPNTEIFASYGTVPLHRVLGTNHTLWYSPYFVLWSLMVSYLNHLTIDMVEMPDFIVLSIQVPKQEKFPCGMYVNT